MRPININTTASQFFQNVFEVRQDTYICRYGENLWTLKKNGRILYPSSSTATTL